MKIACALTASEVETINPDMIIFPEGVDLKEIEQVRLSNINAIIIGAIVENDCSRGILMHRGSNKIEYLKVETDGRTNGSNDTKQNPVYEFDNICVGLLICMDIDNPDFSKIVIDKIISSSAKLKLLCVPADMGSHWFADNNLQAPHKFKGINVILCNHTKTHQDRCKSFITDTQGRKIRVQDDKEPIYAELP